MVPSPSIKAGMDSDDWRGIEYMFECRLGNKLRQDLDQDREDGVLLLTKVDELLNGGRILHEQKEYDSKVCSSGMKSSI